MYILYIDIHCTPCVQIIFVRPRYSNMPKIHGKQLTWWTIWNRGNTMSFVFPMHFFYLIPWYPIVSLYNSFHYTLVVFPNIWNSIKWSLYTSHSIPGIFQYVHITYPSFLIIHSHDFQAAEEKWDYDGYMILPDDCCRLRYVVIETYQNDIPIISYHILPVPAIPIPSGNLA